MTLRHNATLLGLCADAFFARTVLRNRLVSLWHLMSGHLHVVTQLGPIKCRREWQVDLQPDSAARLLADLVPLARRYGFRLWLCGTAATRSTARDLDLLLTLPRDPTQLDYRRFRAFTAYAHHLAYCRDRVLIDLAFYPNDLAELKPDLPFWMDAQVFREHGMIRTRVILGYRDAYDYGNLTETFRAETRIMAQVYAVSRYNPSNKHKRLIAQGCDYDAPVEVTGVNFDLCGPVECFSKVRA